MGFGLHVLAARGAPPLRAQRAVAVCLLQRSSMRMMLGQRHACLHRALSTDHMLLLPLVPFLHPFHPCTAGTGRGTVTKLTAPPRPLPPPSPPSPTLAIPCAPLLLHNWNQTRHLYEIHPENESYPPALPFAPLLLQNWNQTRHQYEIHLENQSTVELCPEDTGIPKIQFNVGIRFHFARFMACWGGACGCNVGGRRGGRSTNILACRLAVGQVGRAYHTHGQLHNIC